jgi:nucleoside diphosphate kinase
MDSTWERPVLALVVRGIDAVKKTETILGHFNPDLARRTNQKSLRSCFGRTRE